MSMKTEATITFSAEVRHALAEAGAERRAADGADQDAQSALTLARAHLDACQQEVDRRTAERSSWIERAARKVDSDIAAGRKPQSGVSADARVQLEHASAAANLEAAQQVVGRRETAGAEAGQRRDAAHARVAALKVSAHRDHAAELLRQLTEHETAIADLRALAGATIYAAEFGDTREFAGVLTPQMLDRLNAVKTHSNVAAIFAERRFVVAVDEPIGGSRDRLATYLTHWRERDAALEAIANGGAVPQEAAA